MFNPESILEMHKYLSDFEIQTNHLILVRQPDLVIVNKKMRICRKVDFVVAADKVKLKKRIQKTDKYEDLAREVKNFGT